MKRRGCAFYLQVAKSTSIEEIRKIFETMDNEELLPEKLKLSSSI